MLKPLLVSGWFRVKPFLKYIAIVIVISPFAGMSLHATFAKQLEVADSSAKNGKSQIKLAESAANRQLNLQFAQVNAYTGKISEYIHYQQIPLFQGQKKKVLKWGMMLLAKLCH